MNIQLETSAIIVVALSVEQLRLASVDLPAYAASLGCPNYTPEQPEADLIDALKKMISSLEASPQLWPWNTNWAIISKQEQAVIGGIDFHGPPDQEGRIEIGYGLDKAFRGQGYMGQAVSLMVAWGLAQPDVKLIEAETYLDNWASQRVLQRKGFVPFRIEGRSLWWRLIPSRA
ncbi:MAG: GNAT family N-acetyltransferase [Anaerolineae bacterium]